MAKLAFVTQKLSEDSLAKYLKSGQLSHGTFLRLKLVDSLCSPLFVKRLLGFVRKNGFGIIFWLLDS